MSRVWVLVLAVILWWAPASVRAAPPGFVFEETGVETFRPNALAFAVDSQSMVGLQAHYLRRFHRVLGGHHVLVGGGLDLPIALWVQDRTVDTLRISAHSAAEFARWGPFGISGQLSTRLAPQHDVLGTAVAWDLVVRAMPGFHFPRGSVGLNVAWQQGLATHVRHSSYVRSSYDDRYPEGVEGSGPSGPKNGWIAFPATRFPVGIHGAGRPSERVSVFTSLSLIPAVTQHGGGLFDLMMVGVLPFHFDIGVSLKN